MALEGGLVVLLIVTEYSSTLFELAAVANQDIPIMVPDLVPEMAEQAAIGLGQFRAPSSWPVITLGPEGQGGSARNSNARPWFGSSARVLSGSFQRSRL